MTLIHSFRDIRGANDTGTGFDRLLAQLATPPTRRTRTLVRADTGRKARKLVEEATEVALDAVAGNRRGTIEESVDLLHHLAVLWRDQGIDPAEIRAEMDRRAAILGIAEKLPRKGAAKKALKASRPAPLYRDGDRIGPVPLSAVPLSAVPLSAIPLSAIPLSPVPLSAVPLSAVPTGEAGPC